MHELMMTDQAAIDMEPTIWDTEEHIVDYEGRKFKVHSYKADFSTPFTLTMTGEFIKEE